MIANDAAVGRNYQRLPAQALEDIFLKEDAATTVGAFREKVIADVRDAMQRIFPGLILNGFGNPLTDGTFRFDKGTSREFLYKNLSGGEKAAFDLLLDFLVKSRTFANTVYCVDEPEAHMNSRVQAVLPGELYACLPPDCQLWLASHSVGMMRQARDIETSNPGTVAFLDFYDIDFDKPQVLRPVRVNRVFWGGYSMWHWPTSRHWLHHGVSWFARERRPAAPAKIRRTALVATTLFLKQNSLILGLHPQATRLTFNPIA